MVFAPLRMLKSAVAGLRDRMGGGPVWRGGPSDMIATLHDDGVLIEVSGSARFLVGAADRLSGRSLFDFVAPDDRAKVRECIKSAAVGASDPQSMSCEFWLLRVRQARARAFLSLRPAAGGRLKALISIASRQPSLSEAALTGADADGAREAAGALSAAAADLSHEMKTPLNAIIGFADAMRVEAYGPLGHEKYAEYADDIHQSGAHLLGLVESILDRAKLAEGVAVFEPVLQAPGTIAAECAAMVRGQATAAGLNLSVEIAPDLPETMIDTRIAKQIVVNLLSNAVKFTQSGGVELSVEENCGAIDFTVRDTGVGMNSVMLAKLGGRFSDTHQTGVRGNDGAGLGLSLCFDLARRHGGHLKFKSTPGKGTVAQFTLPVRRTMDGEIQADGVFASDNLDIQSQLDRVAAFRHERSASAA